MGRALIINDVDFSANAVQRVTFVQGMYINVEANINGAVPLISGGGFYEIGQTATITASTSAKYQFVRWSDGNTNATRTVTVTEKGSMTLTAEYEYVFAANDFIWGNGGITSVKNTTGSINDSASTKTKMIHAITDIVLKIDPLQVDNFRIYAYGIADTNPRTGENWGQAGTYTQYATNRPRQITIQAGKYAQVTVTNQSNSYKFTDLSILPNLLLVAGEYELV